MAAGVVLLAMKKLIVLLPVIIAALIFVGSLTSCSPSPGRDGGSKLADGVPREAALAFAAAHTAWGILDELERDRLKAINDAGDPARAREALPLAKRRNEQLHALRDLLEIARRWLAGETQANGQQALRDGVDLLFLVVGEMKGQGLKVPEQVDAGLASAKALL